MDFLKILNNWVSRSGNTKPEPANPHIDENRVLALTEMLYSKTIAVMNDLPQLQQADFDFTLLKTELLRPIAYYLAQQETLTEANTPFVKPLFVSGVPGIGKTTLLMILDEVLYQLNSSCRDLVVTGKIKSYFPHKTVLNVTPLQLFGKSTGMLSVRDWNNILRHWTFDETTADSNQDALGDLIARLRGKVVFMDEAELEGYVYISELLARQGILVILTSNLNQTQIHLPPEHVQLVSLLGSDHRYGNIANVCLPAQPHELFDRFANHFPRQQKLYVTSGLVGGINITYLNWGNLERQPLMKDDFARLFVDNKNPSRTARCGSVFRGHSGLVRRFELPRLSRAIRQLCGCHSRLRIASSDSWNPATCVGCPNSGKAFRLHLGGLRSACGRQLWAGGADRVGALSIPSAIPRGNQRADLASRSGKCLIGCLKP